MISEIPSSSFKSVIFICLMLVWFLSMYLKPSEIRFTQDSIAERFRDGGYVDNAINKIKNGSLYPEHFPHIEVVDLRNGLYSLDNRRLYVFRVSEYNGWISEIPVNIVSAWNLFRDRFTTKNEGVELYVRQGGTRPHYRDSWLLKQDSMGNRNIPAYQSTSYTNIQSASTSQTLNLPHQTTPLPGIQDTMANLSIGPATVYENLNVVESAVVRRKSIVSKNTSSDSVRSISVSPVCLSSKAPGTTKFSSRTIFVDTISRQSSNVSNTIPSTTASSVRMNFSNTISRQNSAVSGSSRANFSMRKSSMNTILQQRSDVPDSALSPTDILVEKIHYAVSRQNSNASNNIPDSASARNSTVDTISQYSDTSANLFRQTSEASNRIRTPVLDAPSVRTSSFKSIAEENPAIDPPVAESNSEQRQKIALFQRFLNCCCFCCNKS